MAYFAIRDAVGHDYCMTIADSDYAPAFRKHAAWWKRYMQRASAETRRQYERGPFGMPCFPVRIIIDHGCPIQPPTINRKGK